MLYIVDAMKADVNPIIRCKIECYHEEKDLDSSGYTSPREVVTHTVEGNYRYSTCVDVTGHTSIAPIQSEIDESPRPFLIKLKVDKAFEFSNDYTRRDYQSKIDAFKKDNMRDKQQRFSSEVLIAQSNDINRRNNYKYEPIRCVIVQPTNSSNENKKTKHYMTRTSLCLAAMCCCLPCYQTWFETVVVKKKVTIKKTISI